MTGNEGEKLIATYKPLLLQEVYYICVAFSPITTLAWTFLELSSIASFKISTPQSTYMEMQDLYDYMHVGYEY